MDKKARNILQAIAAGHSCEQILADDGSLTYHDIFHVVTETPTSYWKRNPSKNGGKNRLGGAAAARTPARQRSD